MWATITSIIIIFAILKVERCWISDSITETTTPRPSGWGIFICAHFDYFFPFNTFWVAFCHHVFQTESAPQERSTFFSYPQQPQQEEFNTLFGLNLNKKLNKMCCGRQRISEEEVTRGDEMRWCSDEDNSHITESPSSLAKSLDDVVGSEMGGRARYWRLSRCLAVLLLLLLLIQWHWLAARRRLLVATKKGSLLAWKGININSVNLNKSNLCVQRSYAENEKER